MPDPTTEQTEALLAAVYSTLDNAYTDGKEVHIKIADWERLMKAYKAIRPTTEF